MLIFEVKFDVIHIGIMKTCMSGNCKVQCIQPTTFRVLKLCTDLSRSVPRNTKCNLILPHQFKIYAMVKCFSICNETFLKFCEAYQAKGMGERRAPVPSR
jgi:hypothetical protein